MSYPKNGRYEVVIVGTGFSDKGDDHVILINGRKMDVCCETAAKATCGLVASTASDAVGPDGAGQPPIPNMPTLSGRINSDRELVLSGLSKEAFGGQARIQVALGSGEPSAPRTLVLSRLRETLAPTLAAVITAALFLLIIGVVRRSGPTKTTEGFTLGPVGALLQGIDVAPFLDKIATRSSF